MQFFCTFARLNFVICHTRALFPDGSLWLRTGLSVVCDNMCDHYIIYIRNKIWLFHDRL